MPVLPVKAGLAAFWFLFLAGLGSFFPLYSLYLREIAGLSKAEVGTVLAAIPLAGMMSQSFWGALSDRSGHRRRVLAALCMGCALALIQIGRARGFVELVLATFALSIFSSSVIPMLLALGFALLGVGGRRVFGPIRLFGTAGFLMGLEMVTHVPALYPTREGLIAGASPHFLVAAGFVVLAALCGLALPESNDTTLRSRKGDLRRLFRQPRFVLLLGFAFLAHLAIQGPQQQLALILRLRGVGLSEVGNTYRLMLLIEMPLVFGVGWAAARLGHRGLAVLGLTSEALRWWVAGHADTLVLLRGIQALHGISVAAILLGIPMHVEQIVPKELRSSAQAVLATVGIAIGTMTSNLVFGRLLESQGSRRPLEMASLLCLGLAVAGLVVMRETGRRTPVHPEAS